MVADAVEPPAWEKTDVVVSDTAISLYQYGEHREDKVFMLMGGSGEIPKNLDFENLNVLAKSYASDGKQLIMVSMPYFEDERDSIQKASQEVLNILNIAVQSGYLQSGYTLIGGSAGTLMISSMLDFDQTAEPSPYDKINGNGVEGRLIDNVGEVILLAGPHHNAHYFLDNAHIEGLMDRYNVTALTSLDETIDFQDRWGMYLEKLAPNLKIVVGDRDHMICSDENDPQLPCSPDMDDAINLWVETVTDGQYILEDLEDFGIAKMIEGEGHNLTVTKYLDFILPSKPKK
ncbi:MAG TPA: hypothetical protein EYQ26_17115 [Rhodospirillales bacterium]|nr:hypothetical protein [Rhodospirillales bacterium]HIM07516.1 hypothetical protein [Gammaproteobacteria bacterium]